MIFFDTTKSGPAKHRSGLTRVSARLREELAGAATATSWDAAARGLKLASAPGPDDWFLTAELFSEEERAGFSAFLDARPCRAAALFHDAIPLKHPHITWPRSVGRHPGYMKLLARFDRVWAVSAASRDELRGFWAWQGLERTPAVDVLALGADFNAAPRRTSPPSTSTPTPRLLCLGILEPRKNQAFLLSVCDALWTEGLAFELHLIGRVNPHFGAAIVDQLKVLRRAHPGRLFFHEAASDDVVAGLYATARATVFPTIAEGCGLPLLESLWMGVPCVCSDLPVLLENAAGGGCLALKTNDHEAWKAGLRRVISDHAFVAQLGAAATTRALPTWQGAAQTLASALRTTSE